MKHDKFFRDNPVFTSADFDEYLSSQNTGKRTREALLSYYHKTGRIIRVRRGLYATVPAGFNPDIFEVDPFLLTSKMTEDAVISHHTALQLYGKAYSIRNFFTYSASRPSKPLTFRNHLFRGTRFPKALLNKGEELLEVKTMERAGMNLQVTTLERTLVDTLDRPELSGSWEEIWRSLEYIEFFNLDKVLNYVLLLGNSTTAAKVGFFLDQHREELMVEGHHLEVLKDIRPRSPHYLNRTPRQPGHLISEWNLVVPEEVLKQSWGKVL